MHKFHIHYNYSKNYVYSTLGLKHFKNNIIKSFTRNTKPKRRNPSFNYNFLIYSFLSQKDESGSDEPNIEDIPDQYRDLAIVFSKKEADKLPPHRLTDCEIILKEGATLHYGPMYSLTLEESECQDK